MKYVGSKNKISKELIPIIQKYIDDNCIKKYIEPFVGGANVIDKINCENKIGNDIDSIPIDLINGVIILGHSTKELPEIPSREEYYDVRDNPNSYSKFYRSAIMLFASYNSKVYGGGYGAFSKLKDGSIRNYFGEAKRNFEKQIDSLRDTKFINKDYKDLNIENSLIYCDIPYKNSIGYKFKFDYEQFYDWCKEKSKNNIVLVSEYDMPNDGFECVWEKEVKTHMNNRKKIVKNEKLFICK